FTSSSENSANIAGISASVKRRRIKRSVSKRGVFMLDEGMLECSRSSVYECALCGTQENTWWGYTYRRYRTSEVQYMQHDRWSARHAATWERNNGPGEPSILLTSRFSSPPLTDRTYRALDVAC